MTAFAAETTLSNILITTLVSDFTATNGTRLAIDQKIVELEARLRQAEKLLQNLEQPVNFRVGVTFLYSIIYRVIGRMVVIIKTIPIPCK